MSHNSKYKKKLLFLVNDLSFFISHRLPIAEISIKEGFQVVIGYGEIGRANPTFLKKKGFKLRFVPIYRGSVNLIQEIKTFYNIWKFLKKERPDIVHLITIKPYLYGGIISRFINIKGVVSAVSGLGTIFISKKFRIRFLRFFLIPFYKLAFRHKNQITILQNKDDLKLLVKYKILINSKIRLLKGSGVKLENFKNFKEPTGIPIVCFAGRLLRDKGVFEFVSAAFLLKKKKLKARFYLAGDIDTKNPTSLDLKDMEKLKKKKYIKTLGFKRNISKLYANSNIICLPSYREGLPKSLIEAAAASRAVVTTNVPGCRDAIIPNKTGLLVPVRNSQKLANAIEFLIKNPQKRILMGKAGRKFAEKEFAIKKIAQSHINIYQELHNNN